MKPNKTDILISLHSLLSHNVIGEKQLFNRYKGFKAELEFCKEWGYDTFLEGGTIISKTSTSSSLNDAIYFVVVPEDADENNYLEIYHVLSSLRFCEMYLVKYNSDNWETLPVMIFPEETICLPVPSFEILRYSDGTNTFTKIGTDISIIHNNFIDINPRGKNSHPIDDSYREWLKDNLDRFAEKDIINLYVTRLIFDGYIGYGKEKGKSSDIDFIMRNSSGKIRLIEVKEKDLPKKAKKGFGLDVPRIDDFQTIQKASGLKYFLIVRHVEDQKTRTFKEWLFIAIDDFVKDVEGGMTVEGGTGMRSKYSKNPTLICSYDKFSEFVIH
ncbi:MAG: hypothetical protein QNK23_17020 [Crocinitomicaceae bacterium]|nr:hypothetical protein [Crocinitomicaceae bacterium]